MADAFVLVVSTPLFFFFLAMAIRLLRDEDGDPAARQNSISWSRVLRLLLSALSGPAGAGAAARQSLRYSAGLLSS